MRQSDIEGVLNRLPRDLKGRFRGVASLFLKGKPAGPFRYFGTRADDPNDIVPHEHRRDLRGLRCSPRGSITTIPSLLTASTCWSKKRGIRFIKHNLIDFSAVFGAEALQPKSPRAGYVPLFDWTSSAKNFFSFGFYLPGYMRAEHPYTHEIGRLEAEKFKPGEWVSNYYNPAFANMLPDDGFWAAKQVMAFTEPEVRAIVKLAEYSSEAGNEYLIQSLMERREKIGRTYFAMVLPLDSFEASRTAGLRFDDLAGKNGFHGPRTYQFQWSNS